MAAVRPPHSKPTTQRTPKPVGKPAAKTGIAARSPRNSVRIIGGAWRGRRVEFPDSAGLRPTPDRVRETLFNWLQGPIVGARCLDLFAGSGALGLEALSRGAREVIFVERTPHVARGLRDQLIRLGAEARGRVVEMGAARFLRTPTEPFDVVFLDPPFGENALADYLPPLAAGAWVKPGGWVYLESERTEAVPAMPVGWRMSKSKAAGAVAYHLARAAVD